MSSARPAAVSAYPRPKKESCSKRPGKGMGTTRHRMPTDPEHRSYAPPATAHVELSRRPRLTSWDAADHPAQLALSDFLDHAVADLHEQLRAEPPWTLEMTVGLPATIPLLENHDLD